MLLASGITGLTGRFLLRCLRELGYNKRVRCLIRKYSDISWVTDDLTEFCIGDVSDVHSLRQALSGVEGVIHLVNIRYSPQVIQACRVSGVNRVIFVNTTGIFSKFRECSQEYKCLENGILNSNLDYTIIRPTMIYGNERDKNIHKLVKIINKYPVIPIIGTGDGYMQPIYARDLAYVIASAYMNSQSTGKAYNVAGKKPIKYADVLRVIAAALGKKRYFINIPFNLALLCGYVGDKLPNGLISSEKIKRLREDKIFDYSEAERDLGFKPISFEEGIALEVDAMRKAGIIN